MKIELLPDKAIINVMSCLTPLEQAVFTRVHRAVRHAMHRQVIDHRLNITQCAHGGQIVLLSYILHRAKTPLCIILEYLEPGAILILHFMQEYNCYLHQKKELTLLLGKMFSVQLVQSTMVQQLFPNSLDSENMLLLYLSVQPNNQFRGDALIMACKNNWTRAVKALLRFGRISDVKFGLAFMQAVKNGHLQIVRLFDLKRLSDETIAEALKSAVTFSNEEMVYYLINNAHISSSALDDAIFQASLYCRGSRLEENLNAIKPVACGCNIS